MRSTQFLAASAILAVIMPVLAADTKDGFTPLFGKDLSGWRTKAAGKTESVSLDGQKEAFKGRFKLGADGTLTIDTSVKGDVTIETTKTFAKDVHIAFDFKPGTKCNNDIFIRGIKFDLKIEDLPKWKAGEWNQFDLVIKGESAEIKLNGDLVKTVKAKPGATTFGLRAELGPMEMKNLRVKE